MKKSNSTPLSVDTAGIRSLSSTSDRPQSSASLRPSSSVLPRPPSSISSRPPSSASSLRPSSSASTYRALSPASSRPISQASHRPTSRFSHRPLKQASRLLSLCEALVSKVTGLTSEDDDSVYQRTVQNAVRDLDHGIKAAPSIDAKKMNHRIHGLARKARIRSQDIWAEALETSLAALESHVHTHKDLDQEITSDRLPEHLQFLTLLAAPLTESSDSIARNCLNHHHNAKPQNVELTWKEILNEEPFEGQHWEGVYGLPPGSTVEGWETMSLDSTPPLSPLDSDDSLIRRSSSPIWSSASVRRVDESMTLKPEQALDKSLFYGYRQDVETLRAKQYWRKEWHPPQLPSSHSDFNISFPLIRTLGERQDAPCSEAYIHEHDAVREVLIALQGRKNSLLRWSSHGGDKFLFEPISDAPRVAHLTSSSFQSILLSFCKLATTLEHLRKLTDRIYATVVKPEISKPSSYIIPGHSKRITRVTEALAEAVMALLCSFDAWCAAQEQNIVTATLGLSSPVVVSLLSLEKSLQDAFSLSFDRVLNVIRRIMRDTSNPQDRDAEVWQLAELPAHSLPSTISSHVVDELLQAAQDSLATGDLITYEALMTIFVAAAEPIWSAVGNWLRDGMAIHESANRGSLAAYYGLDDEFFIEDNELIVFDPDYWAEGFTLKTSDFGSEGLSPIPAFMQSVAPHILAAGKAVGLLRTLSVLVTVPPNHDLGQGEPWPTLSSIIDPTVPMYSVDDVSRIVFDKIIDRCHGPQIRLVTSFLEDCGLWQHLSTIQDIYLMRRGDIMSIAGDALFAKIDSGQAWTDYHFLNTTLRDAIEANADSRIDATSFRLTYHGSRRDNNNRALECLGFLSLQYSAPFPLTYVLGPSVIEAYNDIFGFILQVRRARHALDRTFVQASSLQTDRLDETKLFHALRSRLSWFVCTLQDFITTHVFQTEITKLHEILKDAKSLDEAIGIHSAHLSKLAMLCFLDGRDVNLYRTVLAVLKMSVTFGDSFIAFSGDSMYNASRPRTTIHQHRSHRVERLRKDTVSFALPRFESSDSESEAEYEAIEERLREASLSVVASISVSEISGEDFFGQVDAMARELDGLVRFFRRGVEGLVGIVSEAAPTFSILAFTLEDWDR